MSVSRCLVRASGLHKSFGKGELAVPVLRGVDIQVNAGELALVMGPSGSGKTTLISILAGLLRSSGGEVELCGNRISEMSERAVTEIRRQHLGFVFQSYNLFPALTALDNVAEVLRLKGLSGRVAREQAETALAAVGLGDRLTHRPGALSGGQKQRVAIARALAGNPSLVFGDELTAALDSHTAWQVMEILRAQIGPTRGILLVTHDRRLDQFADRVIEMEDGMIARIVSGRGGRDKEAS